MQRTSYYPVFKEDHAMRNRKHLPYLGLVLFMFFFSAFIAWCIPYTHDDWDWGREIGITNWLTGKYNNRYVGTFFVILMTRSQILKTLIMAVIMTCLPLLCTYLAISANVSHSQKRIYVCILTYFVVFAMPVITWRQTYGWVSAFSNFSIGSFFLMLLLAVLKYTLYSSPGHRGVLSSVCFFLGLATQLCSENISLVFPFFLAGVMLLLRFWKQRELRRIFLWALLGSVLGSILMFCNPLYLNLATTGVSMDQFRSLIFSPQDPIFTILKSMLSLFLKEILPLLYETHPILVLFLAIGAWIDLFPKRRTAAVFLCIPMILYCIGCCYCASQMRQTFSWVPASVALRTIGAAGFTLLWFVSILLSSNEHKWHTLVFSLFAIALITPFAATNQMGPRCYHISHFCLLVAGASHYDRADVKFPGKFLVSTALVLAILRLSQAYAAIESCDMLRQELIEQALQSQSDILVLPTVDERHVYYWGYNPQHTPWAEFYREFYGLPADIDLVFLPCGSAGLWPNIPEQMYEDAMIYPGT